MHSIYTENYKTSSEKLNNIQINGELYNFHGSEASKLLRCLFSPDGYVDLI